MGGSNHWLSAGLRKVLRRLRVPRANIEVLAQKAINSNQEQEQPLSPLLSADTKVCLRRLPNLRLQPHILSPT